jgi:hypothetical protein
MRQHAIDLLPDVIRKRNAAGTRTGRASAALFGSVLIVVLLMTHARFQVTAARNELLNTETRANYVLKVEEKSQELRSILEEGNRFISYYQELALPLEISSVVATIVNGLPESVTLDRIDLDAGARRIMRTARSKGPQEEAPRPPRILIGEVAGFAASDLEIAELVSVLEQTPPFTDVSLDFSRTRSVHNKSAREFRLSFRIDLERRYEVAQAAVAQVDDAEGH